MEDIYNKWKIFDGVWILCYKMIFYFLFVELNYILLYIKNFCKEFFECKINVLFCLLMINDICFFLNCNLYCLNLMLLLNDILIILINFFNLVI